MDIKIKDIRPGMIIVYDNDQILVTEVEHGVDLNILIRGKLIRTIEDWAVSFFNLDDVLLRIMKVQDVQEADPVIALVGEAGPEIVTEGAPPNV